MVDQIEAEFELILVRHIRFDWLAGGNLPSRILDLSHLARSPNRDAEAESGGLLKSCRLPAGGLDHTIKLSSQRS